jgi:hypothetical protein
MFMSGFPERDLVMPERSKKLPRAKYPPKITIKNAAPMPRAASIPRREGINNFLSPVSLKRTAQTAGQSIKSASLTADFRKYGGLNIISVSDIAVHEKRISKTAITILMFIFSLYYKLGGALAPPSIFYLFSEFRHNHKRRRGTAKCCQKRNQLYAETSGRSRGYQRARGMLVRIKLGRE